MAARGVQVNAIAPGYIATNNTAVLQTDAVRNQVILDRIPAARWGDPEDLGGAAVFLASSASNYVNGHILGRRVMARALPPLTRRSIPPRRDEKRSVAKDYRRLTQAGD